MLLLLTRGTIGLFHVTLKKAEKLGPTWPPGYDHDMIVLNQYNATPLPMSC